MPMDASENDGVGRFSERPTAAPPRLPPRTQRHHLTNNNNNGPAGPVSPAFIEAQTQRPCAQLRRQNFYVDTPRRHLGGHGTNGGSSAPFVHKNGSTAKNVSANLTRDNHVTTNLAPDLDDLTISQQPQSLDSLKPQPQHKTTNDFDHSDSVICLKCRKCKCSSCTDPRELPSRWICGYSVSANTVVEACTCYYCLKGAFYHIFKDTEADDDVTAENDPCACCEKRHCCQRWCCIGIMSLCLPCLCCFPPLKGLVNVVTNCYNCCNRRGCRCNRDRRPSGTKRFLLDSSDGSSS